MCNNQDFFLKTEIHSVFIFDRGRRTNNMSQADTCEKIVLKPLCVEPVWGSLWREAD